MRILRVYENEKYINILMDYQMGGSLGDMLEKQVKISEACARSIIGKILLSLDYMNRRGVIHRDMKPDNILLNENLTPQNKTCEIKVADFGYAMVIPELLPHTG